MHFTPPCHPTNPSTTLAWIKLFRQLATDLLYKCTSIRSVLLPSSSGFRRLRNTSSYWISFCGDIDKQLEDNLNNNVNNIFSRNWWSGHYSCTILFYSNHYNLLRLVTDIIKLGRRSSGDILTQTVWQVNFAVVPIMPSMWHVLCMMTSWHEDVFRITGPLCGESTGQRWPSTRPSNTELRCFLCYWHEQVVEQTNELTVWRHSNVTQSPCPYLPPRRIVVFVHQGPRGLFHVLSVQEFTCKSESILNMIITTVPFPTAFRITALAARTLACTAWRQVALATRLCDTVRHGGCLNGVGKRRFSSTWNATINW